MVSRTRRLGFLACLFVALVLGFNTTINRNHNGEGGVAAKPLGQPGKFNFRVGIMPLISREMPSISFTVGEFKFKSASGFEFGDHLAPRRSSEGKQVAASTLNSSNLMIPGRNIWVVTTASLPWRTGTSVNPTLRAAYLQRETPAKQVTLMVPWIEPVDQLKVFGLHKYTHRSQQEADIRKWLRNDAGMPDVSDKLNIVFYNGRYHPDYGSIFPVENLLALIPQEEADVAILEEPEHLNWFHPETPTYWRKKFNHVLGIIHTNYLVYTQSYVGGFYKKYILYLLNRWMVPAHCDKVIKLSGALQKYTNHKEDIENVHGVRDHFLKIGDNAALQKFSKQFYFISKMLMQKGYPELFDHMEKHSASQSKAKAFSVDVYGAGPDKDKIIQTATMRGLDIAFHDATDHLQLQDYKTMVNPSVSEVLCTTTAEALAMGKFVICPDHPSNGWFKRFPNCLMYSNQSQFEEQIEYARSHEPKKLTPEERRMFTWEAATERLVKSSLITEEMSKIGWQDDVGASFHTWLGKGRKGNVLRRIAGAAPLLDPREETIPLQHQQLDQQLEIRKN